MERKATVLMGRNKDAVLRALEQRGIGAGEITWGKRGLVGRSDKLIVAWG